MIQFFENKKMCGLIFAELPHKDDLNSLGGVPASVEVRSCGRNRLKEEYLPVTIWANELIFLRQNSFCKVD